MQLTPEILYDVIRQMDSKVKFLLFDKGFDVRTNPDFKRLHVVIKDNFDDINELYLDGVLILKWSKFSFKQEGNKLIGTFEYEEV